MCLEIRSATILSCTIDVTLSSDIGRSLEGSVLLLILWMGVTVASLHSCGIVQRLKEMLKRVTRDDASELVASFSRRAGTSVFVCICRGRLHFSGL